MFNEKIHAYSFVRILNNDNDYAKSVQNVYKHLAKSGVKFAYYAVREISPANNLKHVHVLAITNDEIDGAILCAYVDKSRLKSYIDKIRPLPSNRRALKRFLDYIRKDLKTEGTDYVVLYQDYNFSKNEVFNWGHLDNERELKEFLAIDPFIDDFI